MTAPYDYVTFIEAIDDMVKKGTIYCVCNECKTNVTAAYLQSLGELVKCSYCNTNLDSDKDILFIPVKDN